MIIAKRFFTQRLKSTKEHKQIFSEKNLRLPFAEAWIIEIKFFAFYLVYCGAGYIENKLSAQLPARLKTASNW